MRILLERIGAFGDNIIVTPLIHYLKEQGNEVYFMTSAETGYEVVQNNPYIDKIIPYEKDTIPLEQLIEFCKATQQAYECDKLINMAESLEVSLLIYPSDPFYVFPKNERIARGNKNVYDYAFEYAGYPEVKGRGKGELFFTKDEKSNILSKFPFLRNKGMAKQFTVVWGMAGSGRHKAFPAAECVQAELIKKYHDMVIITVGDEACQLLETLPHARVIHMSGKTTLREAMLLTKYVNLVIAPDTGLLHAAGCFSTPKIGLLTHNTKEHVTKYFDNDYSIEAKCDCAPCFRMIVNADIQCPIEPITRGTYCMTKGFSATEVFNRVCEVVEKSYYGNRKTDAETDIIIPTGVLC